MALEFVSGFLVSSLLQEVVDRIRACVAEVNLARSLDVVEELKGLEASYMNAQSRLHDVDGWDLITSPCHQNWVGDVQRVCYKIDDFSEYFWYNIHNKMEDASFVTSLWTKLCLSWRLQEVKDEMNRVISKSEHFAPGNGRSSERKQRSATIIIEPRRVLDDESFRRKRDKDDIIDFLLRSTCTASSSNSNSNSNNINIVLISGLFGIGKTTLAQVVKDDPRVHGFFEHRIWVSVSGDFHLSDALRSMVKGLQEEVVEEPSCYYFSDEISPRRFKQLCKGKRVLIVLDDLCNFSGSQGWEEFQSLLLGCCCNFGVIITTQNVKLTAAVASHSIFHILSRCLQSMSDEDCQQVILKKAALGCLHKRKRCGEAATTMEMVALDMAKNFCKGLPLMADTEWTGMSFEDLWNLPEFKHRIFPSIRLNYSDLSLFLKKSLPYLSLFPEKYNFEKDEVVQLWLAEGFIKPTSPNMLLPDLLKRASQNFDEVVSKSILQIYYPFNQEPQVYRMHEFIRRYAQYIGCGLYTSLDQQFVHAYTSSALSATQYRNACHLSFLCQNVPSPIWKVIKKCEGLRTILTLHEGTLHCEISDELFVKLKSLRVLHLRQTDITELPESIGALKQLRFLDVSRTRIANLPLSVVELYGLQVLQLHHCEQLLQLPKGIENLTQLLHLEIDIMVLKSMPRHIGNLINLHTLPAFFVRRKDGYHITELKGMKYLQGSICLAQLQNVPDEAEAREAMLSNKPFLKAVELKWDRPSRDESIAERIFTGLKPHDNLEELQVTGYDGARFPSWLSDAECKLISIRLVKCRRCKMLPALGQLGHLKALHIQGMDSVKFVDLQFFGSGQGAGFPALESLKFQDMKNLKKWQGIEANKMRRLCEVVIEDCPELTALPSLNQVTSLMKLEVSFCPVLKSLPEEGLPSSLRTLIITSSKLLNRCCCPFQGTDWGKIREIPEVLIDHAQIRTWSPSDCQQRWPRV